MQSFIKIGPFKLYQLFILPAWKEEEEACTRTNLKCISASLLEITCRQRLALLPSSRAVFLQTPYKLFFASFESACNFKPPSKALAQTTWHANSNCTFRLKIENANLKYSRITFVYVSLIFHLYFQIKIKSANLKIFENNFKHIYVSMIFNLYN